MRTIKSVLHQMTDVKNIMQELRETLRELDPMFKEKEEKFLKASACLEQEVGDSVSPHVSEYLAAREEEFVMELIYVGWQGFALNQEIFKNPINALLLREDYEDMHLERRLCTLPAAQKAREIQAAFCRAMNDLPEEKRCVVQVVTRFYSYLQTTGYKLAHYFGFRLADQFLPYVIPGYVSDPVNTFQYFGDLESYLRMDLNPMD